MVLVYWFDGRTEKKKKKLVGHLKVRKNYIKKYASFGFRKKDMYVMLLFYYAEALKFGWFSDKFVIESTHRSELRQRTKINYKPPFKCPFGFDKKMCHFGWSLEALSLQNVYIWRLWKSRNTLMFHQTNKLVPHFTTSL